MACHGVWDLHIRGCKCTSKGVAQGSLLTPEDVQITVGSCLSERIGTEGCSDNRNVRIIEVLTNSIDNTCLKT